MPRKLRHLVASATALVWLLVCGSVAWTADPAVDDAVHVHYAKGEVEIDTVKDGTKCYKNSDLEFKNVPAELDGLSFVRTPFNHRMAVEIDAPAGTTVYLMLGPKQQAAAGRKAATDAGWTKAGGVDLAGKSGASLVLYKQVITKPIQVTIPEAGFYGCVIAAKKISLQHSDRGGTVINVEPQPAIHPDAAVDTTPVAGPTTRIANPQATIKALEIYETDSGLMLGQTSEATLTIVRGDAPKLVDVRFVTPVGDQMCLARDEALRFIHLTYPNWYVAKAEITFEDKYVGHDGGSIGAAIGTMILSVIQGFAIDPNVAITGDISANGKVRAIGGVSAKIRGATESKCTIVAVPMDNYGQLVDMVTYSGPATVTDVQIIGITDLADAVATVRTDRSDKLAKAVAMFAEVQTAIRKDPAYLKRNEAKLKLAAVLDLAPQHLSAKLLLGIVKGEQPKTLSATASQYYTFLAVRSMMSVLVGREFSDDPHPIASEAVKAGLDALKKLRPLADVHVQPLIDAWSNFVVAMDGQQRGTVTKENLAKARQALRDEMAKLQDDPELMQKMLKEGM
jgi:hypothetical protein